MNSQITHAGGAAISSLLSSPATTGTDAPPSLQHSRTVDALNAGFSSFKNRAKQSNAFKYIAQPALKTAQNVAAVGTLGLWSEDDAAKKMYTTGGGGVGITQTVFVPPPESPVVPEEEGGDSGSRAGTPFMSAGEKLQHAMLNTPQPVFPSTLLSDAQVPEFRHPSDDDDDDDDAEGHTPVANLFDAPPAHRRQSDMDDATCVSPEDLVLSEAPPTPAAKTTVGSSRSTGSLSPANLFDAPAPADNPSHSSVDMDNVVSGKRRRRSVSLFSDESHASTYQKKQAEKQRQTLTEFVLGERSATVSGDDNQAQVPQRPMKRAKKIKGHKMTKDEFVEAQRQLRMKKRTLSRKKKKKSMPPPPPVDMAEKKKKKKKKKKGVTSAAKLIGVKRKESIALPTPTTQDEYEKMVEEEGQQWARAYGNTGLEEVMLEAGKAIISYRIGDKPNGLKRRRKKDPPCKAPPGFAAVDVLCNNKKKKTPVQSAVQDIVQRNVGNGGATTVSAAPRPSTGGKNMKLLTSATLLDVGEKKFVPIPHFDLARTLKDQVQLRMRSQGFATFKMSAHCDLLGSIVENMHAPEFREDRDRDLPVQLGGSASQFAVPSAFYGRQSCELRAAMNNLGIELLRPYAEQEGFKYIGQTFNEIHHRRSGVSRSNMGMQERSDNKHDEWRHIRVIYNPEEFPVKVTVALGDFFNTKVSKEVQSGCFFMYDTKMRVNIRNFSEVPNDYKDGGKGLVGCLRLVWNFHFAKTKKQAPPAYSSRELYLKDIRDQAVPRQPNNFSLEISSEPVCIASKQSFETVVCSRRDLFVKRCLKEEPTSISHRYMTALWINATFKEAYLSVDLENEEMPSRVVHEEDATATKRGIIAPSLASRGMCIKMRDIDVRLITHLCPVRNVNDAAAASGEEEDESSEESSSGEEDEDEGSGTGSDDE